MACIHSPMRPLTHSLTHFKMLCPSYTSIPSMSGSVRRIRQGDGLLRQNTCSAGPCHKHWRGRRAEGRNLLVNKSYGSYFYIWRQRVKYEWDLGWGTWEMGEIGESPEQGEPEREGQTGRQAGRQRGRTGIGIDGERGEGGGDRGRQQGIDTEIDRDRWGGGRETGVNEG